MSNVQLASLLSSRLCHDLVGPVGAVSNGIELIGEGVDEETRREADALIASSISQLVRRLAFYRMAFGQTGGQNQQIDVREAERVSREFYLGSRISFDWSGDPGDFDKSALRLALCLIVVAGEALAKGGKLQAKFSEEGGKRQCHVAASGERIILQESMDGVLKGEVGASEITARAAPALLARALADECGASLSVDALSDDKFEVSFVL